MLPLIAQQNNILEKSKNIEPRNNINLPDNQTDNVNSDRVVYHTPSIKDYAYWHENNIMQVIDTSLSISSYNKQNFARKDFFGYAPFSNEGQVRNPLVWSFDGDLLPKMGFSGKKSYYLTTHDIRYFDVKTPMSEIYYRNTMRDGHSLQTLLTHNINRQFNYALQYRGLRSKGHYAQQLASNMGIVASVNYHSKQNQYRLWAHYAQQKMDNQENGGLKNRADFENPDTRTRNPEQLEVNLNGATSEYESLRFYLGQSYLLFSGKHHHKDYQLSLKHLIRFERERYLYKEIVENTYFEKRVEPFKDPGSALYGSVENIFSLEAKYGKLKGELGFISQYLDYGYPQALNTPVFIPREIKFNPKGGLLQLHWQPVQNLNLNAYGSYTYSKESETAYLAQIQSKLSLDRLLSLEVRGVFSKQTPELNKRLHQSFYDGLSYYKRFKNPRVSGFDLEISHKKWGKIELSTYSLKDYIYFDSNYLPNQLAENILLKRATITQHFSYKKIHLDTKLLYQNTGKQSVYIPLPKYLGRLSLYYQTALFKNAAQIQMGAQTYWFSRFASRSFFPVQNEFVLPKKNDHLIGNTPIFDLFLNVKADRMRIYLSWQHFNAEKNRAYSAPNQPYLSNMIRLGILWYLFV